MEKRKKNTKTNEVIAPKAAAVAACGVTTGYEFANLMSALMSDLIDGRITPNIGNATCKAAGQLLRVVELQMKYGTPQENGGKVLKLAMNQPLVTAPSELKQ